MEAPESRPASGRSRVTLMGEAFDPVTPAEILGFAAARAEAGRKGLVVNHNSHSLYLLRRRPELRAVFDRADLVTIDSMPLIFWGKLLGRAVGRAHRSTYTDWRESFWRLAAERRWRVFYLGGAPGVAQTAANRLAAQWPAATIQVRDGYFDPTPGGVENQAVLAQINAFAPDILFVGMGMPLQEMWIAENYDAVDRGVVFSVGAAFDYEAGIQPMPPAWMARSGLQWLHRVAADPKRLAARYFVEPWFLSGAAFRDVAQTLARPSRTQRA